MCYPSFQSHIDLIQIYDLKTQIIHYIENIYCMYIIILLYNNNRNNDQMLQLIVSVYLSLSVYIQYI